MDEINQSVPAPQTPDQIHSSFENSNSSKVIPFIVVAVLLVLVGVGSYVLGTKKSQPAVENEIAVQSIPITTPTPTPDPTADWKTYSNLQYAYSIKYPPSWSYESGKGVLFGPIPLVAATDAFNMLITVENGTQYPPLIGGDARNQIKETKQISIDGINGEQAISVDTGTNEENFLQSIVVHNGKIYRLSSNFPKQRSIYDQMLSAFKFTP